MRQRLFRAPTPEYLAKAALHYLVRYAASEASLRRVLENRIRRAAMRNREFAEDKAAQEGLRRSIDPIIEKYKKSGALNDNAYAETKVNSLRRAGRSARVIRQKLGHAGVDRTVIEEALGENSEETELKAAFSLARRKRLGSFRKDRSKDPDLYRKDLAALARAGLSLAIARQALAGNGTAEDSE